MKLFCLREKLGNKTTGYPKQDVTLPARYRGRLVVDAARCEADCTACIDACPTSAISDIDGQGPKIDLGRCVFCTACTDACPTGAIATTTEFRMATRTREDLIIGDAELRLAEQLDRKARSIFGHSLHLRQVSAGGCNGCEAEINALNNVVFDLSRFGIQMVASPRHADGLLITGPVTANMRLALEKTYAAVPAPKLAIAIGACAISGGPFRDHPQVGNGADSAVPIALSVPGCPPPPDHPRRPAAIARSHRVSSVRRRAQAPRATFSGRKMLHVE